MTSCRSWASIALCVSFTALAIACQVSTLPTPARTASSARPAIVLAPGASVSSSVAGSGPEPAAASSSAPVASSSAAPPAFRCAPPDLGWGFYLPYEPIDGARVSLPILETLPADGVVEAYVHFHASDAARRGMVHGGYPAVFIGVDRGEGSSSYRRDFDNPDTFRVLLAQAEEKLRSRYGDQLRLGPVILSSWSAGFGAVVPLLKRFPDRVRAVVLVDSLYASQQVGAGGQKRPGTVLPGAVAPVEAFARRALRGEKELFLSHSDVPTTGYASTGEVASYLTRRLGLTMEPVDPADDPRGLVARLDRKGLHLRGYAGRDARAHCQHLGLVGQAVESIRDRWPVTWAP